MTTPPSYFVHPDIDGNPVLVHSGPMFRVRMRAHNNSPAPLFVILYDSGEVLAVVPGTTVPTSGAFVPPMTAVEIPWPERYTNGLVLAGSRTKTLAPGGITMPPDFSLGVSVEWRDALHDAEREPPVFSLGDITSVPRNVFPGPATIREVRVFSSTGVNFVHFYNADSKDVVVGKTTPRATFIATPAFAPIRTFRIFCNDWVSAAASRNANGTGAIGALDKVHAMVEVETPEVGVDTYDEISL